MPVVHHNDLLSFRSFPLVPLITITHQLVLVLHIRRCYSTRTPIIQDRNSFRLRLPKKNLPVVVPYSLGGVVLHYKSITSFTHDLAPQLFNSGLLFNLYNVYLF